MLIADLTVIPAEHMSFQHGPTYPQHHLTHLHDHLNRPTPLNITCLKLVTRGHIRGHCRSGASDRDLVRKKLKQGTRAIHAIHYLISNHEQ